MSYTMKYAALFLIWACYSPLALAYQTMRVPTPLRYTFNSYMGAKTPRDNYTLSLTAGQFPCKGYEIDMFNDPSGIGQATINFKAGKPAHIILTGESTSGSSQISMSGNNGSLTVIHSYEGSVGIHDQQQLDFMIPADAPTDNVLLAFSFFPLGSHEVYVSCASVRIDPALADAPVPTIPFSARPDIFISDMNNSCVRDATKEVMFPNPGPDVTMNHTVNISSEIDTVSGTCLPVNGFGNGAKGNSTIVSVNFPGPSLIVVASPTSAPTPSSAPILSPISGAPTKSLTTEFPYFAAIPTIISKATRIADATRSIATHLSIAHPHPHINGTVPNAFLSLHISQNGTCGKTTRCPDNLCCSSYGYCGTGVNYCGSFTCAIGFGACSKFGNGTLASVNSASGRMKNRTVAGRYRWDDEL